MTHSQRLLAACGAMVLLTFIVAVWMVYVRVAEMRDRRIHPQAVATSRQLAERLHKVQASDNFRNLFEVPVLFYALVALALALRHVPGWLAWGAWAYVLLRYVHSAIQCSYNQVLHRLAVFVLSMGVLAALWIHFLVAELGRGLP